MQMQLGDRVTQPVVVPLAQLLVEVFDREAAVDITIQASIRSISNTEARRSDGLRRRSTKPSSPASR